MKTLIFSAALLLALVSCKKKEPTFCWECTLTTTYSWDASKTQKEASNPCGATEKWIKEMETSNTEGDNVLNDGKIGRVEKVMKCEKQ